MVPKILYNFFQVHGPLFRCFQGTTHLRSYFFGSAQTHSKCWPLQFESLFNNAAISVPILWLVMMSHMDGASRGGWLASRACAGVVPGSTLSRTSCCYSYFLAAHSQLDFCSFFAFANC